MGLMPDRPASATRTARNNTLSAAAGVNEMAVGIYCLVVDRTAFRMDGYSNEGDLVRGAGRKQTKAAVVGVPV